MSNHLGARTILRLPPARVRSRCPRRAERLLQTGLRPETRRIDSLPLLNDHGSGRRDRALRIARAGRKPGATTVAPLTTRRYGEGVVKEVVPSSMGPGQRRDVSSRGWCRVAVSTIA